MITSLPKKLVTLGNIRIGHKVQNKSGSGAHPEKLDKFRLTSKNRSILEYAAAHPHIGGDLREWKDAPGDGAQWELYTNTDRLSVFIPTLMAASVTYEKWQAGGCALRCDGTSVLWDAEKPKNTPYACPCSEDNMMCGAQRVLRLNVQLPDLPGLGVWLFHTSGYYATAELLGTFSQLAEMGVAHSIIEGVLCLEKRTSKKLSPDVNGRVKSQTFHYAVPVLWPKFTPRELLAGAGNIALPSSPQKQIAQLSSEMFADEDDARNVSPMGAAKGQDEIARSESEIEILQEKITALLKSQGMSEDRLATYWAKMAEKYHGFTSEILHTLLSHLKDAADKKRSFKEEQTPIATPTLALNALDNKGWRENLSEAIKRIPTGHADLHLEAMAVCGNAGTTDSDGIAMLSRVNLAVKTEDAKASLNDEPYYDAPF